MKIIYLALNLLNFLTMLIQKRVNMKIKNQAIRAILFYGFAGFSIGFLCLLTACNDQKQLIEAESFEEKLYPNEWQFRQRAFPFGTIDQNAYFNALSFRQNKINQANSRNSQELLY